MASVLPSGGPACQVRLSEGRACRVRCATLDYPLQFSGHDKRAPPRVYLRAPPISFFTFRSDLLVAHLATKYVTNTR
jgi:hypothetical protein